PTANPTTAVRRPAGSVGAAAAAGSVTPPGSVGAAGAVGQPEPLLACGSSSPPFAFGSRPVAASGGTAGGRPATGQAGVCSLSSGGYGVVTGPIMSNRVSSRARWARAAP